MRKVMALYVLIALVLGGSYVRVTNYISMQEPSRDLLIISNLTLNYVLIFLLIGAFGTRVPKWLSPEAPYWTGYATALLLGIVLLVVLKFTGMDMRF